MAGKASAGMAARQAELVAHWKLFHLWITSSAPMKTFVTTLALLACAFALRAEIKTETIEYQDGDTTLEGYLAYDTAVTGKRPGVLVVHQWMGLTDYEKMRCEMLAKLGYMAFAVDVYGKGIRPANTGEAGAQAGKYKSDRALLRRRVNAGLDWLRHSERVDTNRLAAIGYCFGGTAVIELARSGADLAGVVSFHGGLDSPTPADGLKIKCKVLALAGADDPFEAEKDLLAFESEMRAANVDWQLVRYGGAVHSFTQLSADGSMKGAKYNEHADHRSWEAMRAFFAELFR
jgi:dienelactone hydrolase